jgi:hypothetical protein
MIAVSSRGTSFRALARYLEAGRSGEDPDRMAWISSRNLPTADPELAARIMRATAEQSQRIQKPVYHLAISFDPTDCVDRVMMEHIADRVLTTLKLQDHQVVIVAHQDREHPHMHLMVNRVHPVTGLSWDGSHDFRRIQEILRATEREFDLREVPGRLAKVPDRDIPDRPDFTPGERRQCQRGEPVFIERVRAHAQEFREATSWDGLEARLARHGLSIVRKGQGIVITDGTYEAKASRIARDLSLRGLERRYGVLYDVRHSSATLTPIGIATRDLRRFEYVRDLTAQQYDAELAVIDAQNRADCAHTSAKRHARAADAFAASLATVYRNPHAARAAFDQLVTARGPRVAIQTLRGHPDKLGTLQTTTQRRLGGLLTSLHDGAARHHATHAAETASALLGTERPRAHEAADAGRAAAHAVRRAAQARAALSGLPDLTTLGRAMAHHTTTLLPAELRHLHTLTVAPHRALIQNARGYVRDFIRGDDERER